MHQYDDEFPHTKKQKKHVVLVTPDDTETGTEEVVRAHTGSGKLHRAISVLVFRSRDGIWETLITKRSGEKLLWPGYWTNAVCTHPQSGEASIEAAVRRLKEEMGISLQPSGLKWVMALNYQAQFTADLAENELDAVYIAAWDGTPVPDVHEVSEWKWEEWHRVKLSVSEMPKHYTPWFRLLCEARRIDTALEKLI